MNANTKVRVIEPLSYAGPKWKALPPSKAGDIITVATAAYAQALVESGLAEYVIEQPVQELQTDDEAGEGSEGKTEETEPAEDEGSEDEPQPDPEGTEGSEDETGETNPEGSEGEPQDANKPAGSGGELTDLYSYLDDWLAKALIGAGFTMSYEVAAATDETLLAIAGVGPKSLKTIREKIAG